MNGELYCFRIVDRPEDYIAFERGFLNKRRTDDSLRQASPILFEKHHSMNHYFAICFILLVVE